MNENEAVFLGALFALNVLAGVGLAVPLARTMAREDGRWSRRRWFVALVGVYFVEGLAIGAGMSIPVFSVGLAFAWGIAVGLRLRQAADARRALRAAALFSLYSSLPALSFLSVPLGAALGGWNVLSPGAGVRFGIPELPGPLSPFGTILGFYLAVEGAAAVFKVVITTGEVSMLMHLRAPRPASPTEGSAPQ